MRSISNYQYDAIVRLLGDYITEDMVQTTRAAERRRKTKKVLKYLNNKRNE